MSGIIGSNQNTYTIPAIHDVRISHESHYSRCQQCGACTASCPASSVYRDFRPRELMQRLSIGLLTGLEAGTMAWRCGQCYSCKARCPRGCNAAIAFLALREEALREGTAPEAIVRLAARIKSNLYSKGETMLPSTFSISPEALGPETARRCADNPSRRRRLGYADDEARATPMPEGALREVRALLAAVGYREGE